MMGGRGGEFNAAEAVSPGGMTPAEWNAIPGASGGAVPASGPFDWRKALAAGGAGFASAPQGQTSLMPASSPVVSTTAQPINFDIVSQFLQSILQQAGAGRKGKK